MAGALQGPFMPFRPDDLRNEYVVNIHATDSALYEQLPKQVKCFFSETLEDNVVAHLIPQQNLTFSDSFLR